MNNIDWKKELKQSTLTALWFVFLTFPLMVMKVTIIGGEATTSWRWINVPIVGVGSFVLSFVWRQMLERREYTQTKKDKKSPLSDLLGQKKYSRIAYGVLAVILMVFPFIFSMYQTTVMISVLIYIVLGLGLNIVVGYGGLLHLGYAAFYAVGAYTYGLFFHFMGPLFMEWGINTGLMFWIAIPAAGLLSLIFGFLVCLPVIRLRGDYLAIVTLAFGEITRMFLENQGALTQGPSGISLIPRPWLLGIKITPVLGSKYLYFIALVVVLISIKVVKNLEDSRIGRAWEAMREDDIAAESMGLDLTKGKLAAFAVGAMWAGFAGVLLAAKTTFINPASFTLWESVIILCVVVLGGMGSIPGIVFGSILMIMLPEYFRFFAEYRMLIFGIALVLMMIFRQGGIIPRKRKVYTFEGEGLLK
jgi:branched-chain amino acid transport system permease protein